MHSTLLICYKSVSLKYNFHSCYINMYNIKLSTSMNCRYTFWLKLAIIKVSSSYLEFRISGIDLLMANFSLKYLAIIHIS